MTFASRILPRLVSAGSDGQDIPGIRSGSANGWAADSSTISVLIPAYNAAPFVAAAVSSALAQTHPPHEIIVVDDGSSDDTPRVLESFGNRIRVIRQDNRGLSAARNVAAAAATGAWLAFLDADDTWLPTKLQRQLEVARHADVALVYSDRFNRGVRGALPIRQGDVHDMYSGDVFVDLLVLGNRITASSVIVRRQVFQQLNGFAEDIRVAEDWDLWIRVAELHHVGVVHEPLVNYTFHDGMLTRDPERMRVARNQIIDRALASARGTHLPARVRRRIRAAVARTNAWDAARRAAHRIALEEYTTALRATPWDAALHRDVIRYVFRRHA